MPETGTEDVRLTVERCLETFRAHAFVAEGREQRITISVGAVLYQFHAVDKTALIRIADEALYEAKHAGRDRAVFPPTYNSADQNNLSF